MRFVSVLLKIALAIFAAITNPTTDQLLSQMPAPSPDDFWVGLADAAKRTYLLLTIKRKDFIFFSLFEGPNGFRAFGAFGRTVVLE